MRGSERVQETLERLGRGEVSKRPATALEEHELSRAWPLVDPLPRCLGLPGLRRPCAPFSRKWQCHDLRGHLEEDDGRAR